MNEQWLSKIVLMVRHLIDPGYRGPRRRCHSHIRCQTGYYHTVCGYSSITTTSGCVGLRNKCTFG